MNIETERGPSPEDRAFERNKNVEEQPKRRLETPEYASSYDSDVQDVWLESAQEGKESVEALLEKLEAGGAEALEELERESTERAALAIAETEVSAGELEIIKNALVEIAEGTDLAQAEGFSGKIVRLLERRYGASKETVYKAFKSLGIQGLVLNIGETFYNGYRAARAESPEERQESLDAAWSAAKRANPLLIIPEAVYRGKRFLEGDEAERAQQKAGVAESMKESSFVWRWVLGNEQERRQLLDQGKATAIMFADGVTLGSAAVHGVTKETVMLAKDARELSGVFTKKIDGLQERMQEGEKVTLWDVTGEFVRAGMEAGDKTPQEVVELMGESLRSPEFMRRLPGGQQSAIASLAEALQTEKGQKAVLERVKALDVVIQRQKENA